MYARIKPVDAKKYSLIAEKTHMTAAKELAKGKSIVVKGQYGANLINYVMEEK